MIAPFEKPSSTGGRFRSPVVGLRKKIGEVMGLVEEVGVVKRPVGVPPEERKTFFPFDRAP